MACGLCGSGICADEKFKKQKNGNVHRYVYYGCTKARDKNCKCGYIEEKELVKQFEGLIDKIDLNEISVKEKIECSVKKIKGFMKFIFNKREDIDMNKIDVRNYVKYVLREGEDVEKRELLGCLKGDVLLSNKTVSLKS